MKEELQNKLFEKYPNIFNQRSLSPQETAMCWGITCGDGWFDIIDSLCFNIKSHIDITNNKLDLDYKEKKKSIIPIKISYLSCEATQVKSKFGGLRFYVSNYDEYIKGAISMAEAMSHKVCEECGVPAKTDYSGWACTLCSSCKDEIVKIKKKRHEDFEKFINNKRINDE